MRRATRTCDLPTMLLQGTEGDELRAGIILTHQAEHDTMFTNRGSSQPHSLGLVLFLNWGKYMWPPSLVVFSIIKTKRNIVFVFVGVAKLNGILSVEHCHSE